MNGITMILDTGEDYAVPADLISRLKADYGQYVNVDFELLNMKNWLYANPSRRKTKRGMSRFITSWIIRSAESAAAKQRSKTENLKNRSFDLNDFFDIAVKSSYKTMHQTLGSR